MRRLPLLAVLAVLALALAGCGGSGAPKNTIKITFGRTAGLIVPYSITIARDGKVTAKGTPPVEPPATLTNAEAERLSRLVRSQIGKLNSTLFCAHTLPDEASSFITALGKTVAVRGGCEPRFTKLFYELTNALGLNE